MSTRGSRRRSPHTPRAEARRPLRRAAKRLRRAATLPVLITDPVDSAEAAGLRHVDTDGPGIRRRRRGSGFGYVAPDGSAVRDAKTLARIKALAIPPAWTQVWICPSAEGHIQAVGRDARGRKQYRYHARFRAVRDETKYNRMIAFGQALRPIRERVERDLSLPGLPRDKVVATVVRLLETTLIRVGNEEYARSNKSFGLTTMRNQHVSVEGTEVRFRFRGKSGKHHVIAVHNPRLARIVRRCQDLPGQQLFEYVAEDGQVQTVDSTDVNRYLREVTGQEFTAKDFRTWAGTVLAALALRELAHCPSSAAAKRNVVQAIERVAQRLGNTPSICRKCYVHPAVLDAYMDGSLIETLQQRADALVGQAMDESFAGLPPDEAAVMALLQQRLVRAREEQDKAA